ncbi:hypothetical protein FOL47_007677 [Perkinsus chesapeaki]|uniref:Uncharacterized protein n=1 Tax=Perkinsus chesapeaki TaxID=330153 RepID=A0A7J6LJB0_PERCH|nr:hypothetical protein FOL47_007677 [Perkinsus chesapeaki]
MSSKYPVTGHTFTTESLTVRVGQGRDYCWDIYTTRERVLYIDVSMSFHEDGTAHLTRTISDRESRYKCKYTAEPAGKFIQVEMSGYDCEMLVKGSGSILDDKSLKPILTSDKTYLTFYQGKTRLTYKLE